MARRRGFLSRPRLVLLLVVLGDVLAMAMSRPAPLLDATAETPLPAEGPDSVARPGGGRHDDPSIAGAEVILAGFAATVMAVIFLYIRVTRKSNHRAAGLAEKA